jgi:hypothetical protein
MAMPAVVEILPELRFEPNRETPPTYLQPRHSAVDVAEFRELFLTLNVCDAHFFLSSGQIVVTLQTASINEEADYSSLVQLCSFTYYTVPAMPYVRQFYLKGAGYYGAGQSGFARYIRTKIELTGAADRIVLNVRGIGKP